MTEGKHEWKIKVEIPLDKIKQDEKEESKDEKDIGLLLS